MSQPWAVHGIAESNHAELIYCTKIAPGIVSGPAAIWSPAGTAQPGQSPAAPSASAESRQFEAARGRARRELDEIVSRVGATVGSSAAAIFAAHAELLDDPAFRAPILNRIQNEQMSAELAVHATVEEFAGRFASAGNGYLAARAEDLAELGDRLLRHLRKEVSRQAPSLARPSVLIGNHLGAADIIILDRHNLLALVMIGNGPTSHAALLAATLGVPVVVAPSELAGRVREGDLVIVDANRGLLQVNPSAMALQVSRVRRELFERFRSELAELRDAAASTPDGRTIHLAANVGLLQEVAPALAHGAESIGLLRTEYYFLSRNDAPSEEEQYAFYSDVVRAVAPRRVTFRTLDLGGDKPPPGSIAVEPNPMMGCRGVRLLLERRDLFSSQIRALFRTSAHGPIRVMFPLITSLTEFQETMAAVRSIEEQLREEGVAFDPRIPFGCMVETPAAAMIADILATEADFLSIGTNDLIQFALAADRTNARVAHIYEPLHLAILRMMRAIIRAARRRGRQISLCGEMAADPIYSIILLGMGVDELSMSPEMIPAIKRIIRGVTWAEASEVARGVLRERRTKDVAAYLEKMMENRFPQLALNYGPGSTANGSRDQPDPLSLRVDPCD